MGGGGWESRKPTSSEILTTMLLFLGSFVPRPSLTAFCSCGKHVFFFPHRCEKSCEGSHVYEVIF